jgi:hypothetical protein
MHYSQRLLANPYLWALVSALFLAAAVNRASRPAAHPRWRAGDLEKARTAKWTLFSLYLSLALAAALGALVVPGSAWIGNPVLLYFYLGATVFFFLAFRFKKSAGSAAVLLLVALAVTLLLFFRSLTAFTGESEIGRVRVLAARGEQMTLELLAGHQDPVIATLDGTYFAPVVKVVIFDDAFVFLGARSWYRFEALTSFARETTDGLPSFRQQSRVVALEEPLGISENLWELFERYDNRIPGVRSAQVEMDLKKARELTTYSLRIQNDGGLQILEVR